MAVASTDTIREIMHSTLTKSRKKLVVAIAKANVLMAWAMASNRVEYEDGGYEITNPLALGRNPNVTSMRYYDAIPISQTDEFDTAKYYFSRVVGTMMISEQELDENRGQAKIFDLVAAKMDILEQSFADKFTEYLYGVGSNTDPNGLGLLVPADPTTGTVGNLNQATIPGWRTSSYDFNGTLDSTNIEVAFDDIAMDLTVKTEKPDVGILGRNLYRLYRQAVRDKIVITQDMSGSPGAMADLGFDGVKHNRMTLIFDEDCPVNDGYWLNSKYLRMHVMRHVNMKVKELTAPWTHDVIGKRVVWQGQWCRWAGYRKMAYITNS